MIRSPGPLSVLVAVTVAATTAGCTDPAFGQPGAASGPSSTENTRVTKVADGDTVTIAHDGDASVVRVLGIDAPEVAHGSNAAQCGGAAAQSALRTMLMGKTVRVVSDPHADTHDRFGRTLAYLELDGIDVGLQMVRQGLAEAWHPKSAPEPTRYRAYVSAERAAHAGRVGSWSTCSSMGRPQ